MALDTRRKILNAARELFARNGFEGSTVDEIAAQAGVNKASIYYHYKDKASLYERVVDENLSDFLARVRQEIAKKDSPADKLEAFIFTYGKNFQRNKAMANLMLRELASDGMHLTDSTRKIMKGIIMEVDMILKKGVAEGVFNEASTFIAYIIMVGSMNIFTSTQKMRKQFRNGRDAFGFSLSQQEAAAEISGILLNGLLKNQAGKGL